ncbi:hypothetical protein [Streptomyces anandii]|uniref:hypothetical protein n=1 Tax=Streptomyces anandii TaxID=285454 RepID=UPI0037A4AF6E
MKKLARAAVMVMAGGVGLVGTAAHACDYGNDGASGNRQFVRCGQTLDGGLAFAPVTGAVTGDSHENIGNSCAVVGTLR